MIVWAIKRSDGKWYKGAGGSTWRGSPSWKNEIHSASLLKEVYLERALSRAKYKCSENGLTFQPVKIKIEEVAE